ncbi:28S ribosomal protein S10, mitochondrial [Acyrthosiphon pisum]|uniref:Small ribosomal subunit protein uS10m n=1 Tax=Acyrthosiphon pisum TaxID=7029 RepID=C4WW21_ACYPI|nr:28S ribosomal protein S10, mitochondrial [Acyrthosiphon pisum]BAH72091.1 ACYPI007817 [Acyrthosiphon pisum]|eukprot:NP_001155731.1 28S ribosomal protein S10, mitochondrial [Acyrthosiphon pisum]
MTTFLKTLLLNSRKSSALWPPYFNLSTRSFCAKPLRSEESNIHQNDLASVTPQNEELDKLYKTIEFECRSNDRAVLRSYTQFATMAANELGIQIGKCWSPRKAHHERYTLLRSIHVHKRCRVQYEVRTWFRFIHFHKLTGSTAETFLEYVQRNLPEGVALKVTKVLLENIPESVSSHMTSEIA